MQELANTLCVVTQYDEALLLYQKIFETDTSLIGALYNIGYVLKKQGNINEAIQVLEKVIEITPDNAHAHLSLGMAYLTMINFMIKAGRKNPFFLIFQKNV